MSRDGGRKEKTDLYRLSFWRSFWLNYKDRTSMMMKKKKEQVTCWKLQIHATLICVTWLSVSSGNESHLCSAGDPYEIRQTNGPFWMRCTRLSSVSPFRKMLRLAFCYGMIIIKSFLYHSPIANQPFDVKLFELLTVSLYKTSISKFYI